MPPWVRVGRHKAPRDDFDRLEEVVRRLVDRVGHLRSENIRLKRDLAAREDEAQQMGDRLIEANQLRQDAIKRIDELLSQLDHLDTRLAIQDGGGGD